MSVYFSGFPGALTLSAADGTTEKGKKVPGEKLPTHTPIQICFWSTRVLRKVG
jgi:hypothetical protein